MAITTTSDKRREKKSAEADLLARALPMARAALVLLTWERQLSRLSHQLGLDLSALRRHTERFADAARRQNIL